MLSSQLLSSLTQTLDMTSTATPETGFSDLEILEKVVRDLEKTKDNMIKTEELVSQWVPRTVRKDGCFISCQAARLVI